jgi:hypothetical protein
MLGLISLHADWAAAQPRARLRQAPAGAADLSPVPPSGYGPGAAIGQPSFDAYAQPNSGGLGSWLGGANSAPPAGQPLYDSTVPQPPAWSGGYQTTPPALFPEGATASPNGLWGNGAIVGPPVRFIQGPRFRHGWLAGDEGREVDINETDVSVVLSYPNFLFSNQPLYVAPSFSLTLWDNPQPPQPPDFPPGADLPAQVYGAYLDSYWRSDLSQPVGGELGVRVGVYSDFNTLTTDSLRVQGLGMLRLRWSPTLSIRGGVMYTDRIDIKLIPAGGILWEPNPQTRFDFFFPQPKLAQYLTTLGNYDVWWYVAGEFGGNSWTIERAIDGITDRVDQNDLRAIVGVEWGRPELFREGRRIGFFEAGWVTDREFIYFRRPEDNFTLRDTFLLRAGIGY